MDIGAVPRGVVDLLLGGSAGDLADETHLVQGEFLRSSCGLQ